MTKEEEAFKTNLELDLQIEKMIEKNGELWQCKVCSKMFKSRSHVSQHAETHIEGLKHNCHLCNKPASTRHALKDHMRGFHTANVSCKVCGKSGMNKNKLKHHKQVGCKESEINEV